MLRDILAKFMPHAGLQTSQRELAILVINGAAKEIYNNGTFEPLHCLREQVFEVEDVDTKLVTLPSFVGAVKAIREATQGFRIDTVDMRPRYQTNGWKDRYLNGLTFRLRHESPIHTDIVNAGFLKFSLSKPAAEAFSIATVGSTPDSARVQELVSFAVGDQEKQTTNSFETIETLAKSVLTTYDVTVKDIEDNELAVIPNCQYDVNYKQIEIPELPVLFNSSNRQWIECCYKLGFQPFKNDYDSFPASGYDDAIYWKALVHWFARKEDKVQDMIAAAEQFKVVMDGMTSSVEDTITKKLDFTPNPYLNIFDNSFYGDNNLWFR